LPPLWFMKGNKKLILMTFPFAQSGGPTADGRPRSRLARCR
jgi:hypothetical protein